MNYDGNPVLSSHWKAVRNPGFSNIMVTTDIFNSSNFRMSKGNALAFYTAVALPERSPYTRRISEICVRLEETGLVKYLNAHYAIKAGVHQASYEEMAFDPKTKAKKERPPIMISLSLRDLGGSSLILFGGWGVSLLAFLYELLSSVFPRKKMQSQAGSGIDA